MKKQKGFSLIELLIVVAIILIIAAIAIPNLLRAKIAANEASAVGSMRTIVTGEISYASAQWLGSGQYSAALGDLGGSGGCTTPTATATCLIDDVVAKATASTTPKSGYYFTYAQGTSGLSFSLKGDPASAGQTGTRHFFADQTGVIRFNATAAAGSTDSALQ